MYSCARRTRAACASCGQRRSRRGEAPGSEDGRNGAAQCPYHFTAQALPFSLAAVMQQGDGASQMIEHQQGLRRDIMRMRCLGGIETAPGHALEVADGIVRRIADQAAEQRHPRHFRQRLRGSGQRAAQGVQELELGLRPGRMHAPDVQPRGLQAHFQAVAESDEGIACQPLSPLDALQQESRPKGRQLQIGRHRRIEIGCDVKRWLHAFLQISRTTKNPPPALRRRWVLGIDELN